MDAGSSVGLVMIFAFNVVIGRKNSEISARIFFNEGSVDARERVLNIRGGGTWAVIYVADSLLVTLIQNFVCVW